MLPLQSIHQQPQWWQLFLMVSLKGQTMCLGQVPKLQQSYNKYYNTTQEVAQNDSINRYKSWLEVLCW